LRRVAGVCRSCTACCVQTTVLGDLPLVELANLLATVFEELLANSGPGLLRSPDTALDLLTIPDGHGFSSAFGADVVSSLPTIFAARAGGGGSGDSCARCCRHPIRPGRGRGCCVWTAGTCCVWTAGSSAAPPPVLCVRFNRSPGCSLVVAPALECGVQVGCTDYIVASGVLSNGGGYSSFVNTSMSDGVAVWQQQRQQRQR
jgi:hypothetical protein